MFHRPAYRQEPRDPSLMGVRKLSVDRRLRIATSFARRARSISAALLLLSGSVPSFAQDNVSAEYRSKASFLVTFPSFIDWPEEAFPSAQAAFSVCVRGDFPFGTLLAEDARTASPHGRRMEVRWVHSDEDLRNCHIVFVSHSESKRYVKLLQTLQGADVLTVGETPGFLDAGGVMTFTLQHELLQFDVNLAAANGAHLRISSQLLVIARRVVNSQVAAKS